MTQAANLASLGSSMSADGSGTVTINAQSSSAQFIKPTSGNNADVVYQDSNSNSKWITTYRGGTGGAGDFWIYNNALSGKVLGLDTSGRMTLPFQPAFSARQTSTGLTTATDAEQKFDVVVFNTGSYYNASTGRFTAPIAGKYYFAAQLLGSNTNARAIFYLAKNNSQNVPTVEASSTANQYTSIGTFGLFDLAAGDYISVKNGGSSENLFYSSPSNQNWFIGYLIG